MNGMLPSLINPESGRLNWHLNGREPRNYGTRAVVVQGGQNQASTFLCLALSEMRSTMRRSEPCRPDLGGSSIIYTHRVGTLESDPTILFLCDG